MFSHDFMSFFTDWKRPYMTSAWLGKKVDMDFYREHKDEKICGAFHAEVAYCHIEELLMLCVIVTMSKLIFYVVMCFQLFLDKKKSGPEVSSEQSSSISLTGFLLVDNITKSVRSSDSTSLSQSMLRVRVTFSSD